MSENQFDKSKLKIGQEVFVKAWWEKDKSIKCKIYTLNLNYDCITVKPVEGNPHIRMIDIKNIDRIVT